MASIPQPILELAIKLSSRLIYNKSISDTSRKRLIDNLSSLLPAVPSDSKRINLNGLDALWVSNNNFTEETVMLYFHGGGYHICSPDTHHRLVHQICKAAKAKALIVDYRMAPEHPYPAAVEDCFMAYQWLIENNVKPANIVFAGDSAGGGLTMAVLLLAKAEGITLPTAAVCLSPWVDLTGKSESHYTLSDKDPMLQADGTNHWAKSYLNGAAAENPLASPLFGELEDLPPLLIHVGENEILLDDATKLHAKATRSGVKSTLKIWPSMMHVFQVFHYFIDDARQAIAEIGSFIKVHTSTNSR